MSVASVAMALVASGIVSAKSSVAHPTTGAPLPRSAAWAVRCATANAVAWMKASAAPIAVARRGSSAATGNAARRDSAPGKRAARWASAGIPAWRMKATLVAEISPTIHRSTIAAGIPSSMANAARRVAARTASSAVAAPAALAVIAPASSAARWALAPAVVFPVRAKGAATERSTIARRRSAVTTRSIPASAVCLPTAVAAPLVSITNAGSRVASDHCRTQRSSTTAAGV